MSAGPPRLAAWIVSRLVDFDRREDVLGDLLERFARRAQTRGGASARRWYWREALAFAWHVGRHRAGALAGRLGGAWRMSTLARLAGALVQDFRYGWRTLAARPAFSGVAVLVLVLGIGANSAIFTLMNEALLQPRPGDEIPGELVGLYSRDRARPDRYRMFSYPNYVDTWWAS